MTTDSHNPNDCSVGGELEKVLQKSRKVTIVGIPINEAKISAQFALISVNCVWRDALNVLAQENVSIQV